MEDGGVWTLLISLSPSPLFSHRLTDYCDDRESREIIIRRRLVWTGLNNGCMSEIDVVLLWRYCIGSPTSSCQVTLDFLASLLPLFLYTNIKCNVHE